MSAILLPLILQGQSYEYAFSDIKLRFLLDSQGEPMYQVWYKNNKVTEPSALGLVLKSGIDLSQGLNVVKVTENNFDETWSPILGQYASIKNSYKEVVIVLQHQQSEINLEIVFRMYAEGVAFRYRFPKQPNLNYFVIKEEKSNFHLTANHSCFWIPADFDSQEYVYTKSLISEIDNSKLDLNNGIALKSIQGNHAVQSPLMLKSREGLYLNIFEAAVDNYPVMHLNVDIKENKFTSLLAPNATGDLAFLQCPAQSPWRTLMVSDDARDIVSSSMILNLNEPNKLSRTDYIKPMKYVGIWWEMHVGLSTWDYAGSQNAQNAVDKSLIPSGKHGATTANTKRYIDFAAAHGFDGVLIEGWNVGWEDWFGNWKEEVFDFTTPYPDFNLDEVTQYAKSKGVKLIMHHETSGSAANYERHLDRAFNLMQTYGYPAVKTGYVGRIIPRGEYHDGQTMVNHFHHVVKRAAEYGFMVNSHESSRPTGMHRTYPNYIAAEAARGNEFNGWSNGNPPAHETILPFTRLLGGPMDYTPGIFETKMNRYDSSRTAMVHTTLCKQLALYVTLYSPLQMAADLPENYEKYLDAFQFIKEVALDWDQSLFLEAEPGEFLTVARKAKGSEKWFLGAITNENGRITKIELKFLSPGKIYRAHIYQDSKNAHWETNPKAYEIMTKEVNQNTTLELRLAQGGGVAIYFEPIK